MNKKKVIVICVALLLIAAIAVGAVYFFGQNKSTAEAEKIAEEFLSAYSAKEMRVMDYLDDSVSYGSIEFDGFQGLMAEQIEFEIKDAAWDENLVIVKVEVTNVDFRAAFEEVIDDMPQDAAVEEILAELEERLASSDCPKRVFECEVIVDSDSRRIIMSDTLSNALFGGYNEYIAELTADMGE